MNFKKGDRVKCIDRERGDVPQIGDIGICLDGGYNPIVDWSGTKWAMMKHELKLI